MEEHTDSVIQNVENARIEAPIAVPIEPTPLPRGNGSFLVVRDGYQVKEIEGSRRGKRVHRFHDLGGFARWLDRHAMERERAEILVATDQVVAALDPADPDGDLVSCELPLHPSFAAWTNVLETGLDQITLHRLVLAEAETLGDSAVGFSAALLQVKLATAGEFDAQMDPLGYMRVTGGTNKQEATVKLPPQFVVTTPIIEGVGIAHGDGHDAPTYTPATYALDIFLQLKVVGEPGSKRAEFYLSCPRLEAHRRQARRDAAEYLQALLLDGFLVGLGEIKTESVREIG